MSEGLRHLAEPERVSFPSSVDIRSYDRRWLREDLIAGIAVAALLVPKTLATRASRVFPLQSGLYAATAGAILYTIFGTGRQISTGPSSGLAAVCREGGAGSEGHRRTGRRHLRRRDHR
jgi:MFS superfamily sulfate permease-like transporter